MAAQNSYVRGDHLGRIDADIGSINNLSQTRQDIIRTDTKMIKVKRTLLEIINYMAFPFLLIMLWEIFSKLRIFPPAILPSVETLSLTFVDGIKSGEIPQDLFISLVRVLKGYSIGIILGLLFGVGMGISFKTNKFFTLIFNGIRQIPPLAWVPLLILWFGIGETSKVVLIAKSSFFPILLNTINGIRNIPQGYLEVAKLYKIHKIDLVSKVYFPSTIPSVFVGLRLGAGAAWMSVVAAEMIASTSGIGYRINDARNLMQSDVVLVDMIIIGLIGGMMDFGLKYFAKRVSKWESA